VEAARKEAEKAREDAADADEAQWFPFVVNGSWWQFSVAIPQYTLAATTAFQGIYVRWQEVGRAS
jgi:hypothetical protein